MLPEAGHARTVHTCKSSCSQIVAALHRLAPVACILCFSFSAIRCGNSPTQGPPFAPDDALATIQVDSGFRVELVAAEPIVMDPVAMAIDEYGRLYVAEMPGYPLDTHGSGRITMLRDTDGDHLPDTAVLFADSLRLPTGIMRWKKGVLVTDPPDILYLEDTDGDGRSDVRQVVLTGFALSNPQHNVNTPKYGLDNWITVANNATIWWTEHYADQFGDRGSEVHYPAHPEGPRLAPNGANRNVRFRPDSFELEARSGKSQFGHTFNAWGHHFLNDNSHHHYHEVIGAEVFERNPDLPVQRATHYTSDHGNAAAVFPITLDPEHQLLTDRGVFTSACGITYYMGGLFPAPYDRDVTFTAEPVHNLVHADKVTYNGPTYTASRITEGREFLASTDSWFRPVNFSVGPDGALYVVDYYRQIVEHPEWMDDDARTGDLHRGSDRGRIYRVIPNGTPPPEWLDALTLGDASTATLVAHLESNNAWWRLNAQRLLVDRRGGDAADLLARLVESGTSPEARVHALWTLDGLDRLDAATLRTALADTHARVRENAIRLAEQYAPRMPDVATLLMTMETDPDLGVRFQLMSAASLLESSAAKALQHRILLRDMKNAWVQTMGLLVLGTDLGAVLQDALAQAPPARNDTYASYLARIAALIGASGDADAIRALLRLTRPGPVRAQWWNAALLGGLAGGLQTGPDDRGALDGERAALAERALQDMEAAHAALSIVQTIGLPPEFALGPAVRVAEDQSYKADVRARALGIIALGDADGHVPLFRAMIQTAEPLIVQRAAIEALGSVNGETPAHIVLEEWSSLTPALRQDAIDLMITEVRAGRLLDAIEDGVVLAAELSWRHRVVLMRDTRESLRSRARSLLSLQADLEEVTEDRYSSVLDATGNAQDGTAIFHRVCAACHRAGPVGATDYGPDLSTVQHWPRKALLAKILDPSQSIANGYELWTVERSRGDAVHGVMAQETPTSITIRSQHGEEVVLRADIESVSLQAGSGMPPGLITGLDEADIANLLAFLRME